VRPSRPQQQVRGGRLKYATACMKKVGAPGMAHSRQKPIGPAAAVKLLQSAGAKWIYKKVESILRGQVTAKIEVMMSQLGFPFTRIRPGWCALKS